MKAIKVARGGVGIVAAVLLCGIASAADTAPASGPEIADRGGATPRAALETMAELFTARAPTVDWLGLQPPANRDLAKEQMELITEMGAKAKSVGDLVEQRIGKTEANMIRVMQPGVTSGWELWLKVQMQGVVQNGKLNWAKVKINENGDKADIVLVDANDKIPLAKAEGKWYLGDGSRGGSLAQDLEGNRKATASSMKLLDQVEQRVKAGTLTKKNWMMEYPKLLNETMSGG